MADLFLTYTDDNGADKRLTVAGNRLVVGRHSESDLCIPDGRLSRQHLKIERRADEFIVADAGSSNGSKLNDIPLTEPMTLKDGDVLDLGGLRVQVEIDSGEAGADPDIHDPEMDEPEIDGAPPGLESGITVASQSQAQASSGSGYGLLFVIIPVAALILLLFAGGVIYLVVRGSGTNAAKKSGDDFIYSKNESNDNESTNKKGGSNTSTTGTSGTNTSANSGPTDPGPGNSSVPPGKSDTAKVEVNGGAFLRRIAQNDPRAFMTSEQAQRVNPKVKQLSGSSALADNLNSARKNADKIKSLAASKNLKPEFLAIAAVAKLGSSRGDVYQTAEGMAERLKKLSDTIGNEFGEDSLLIMAAYSQSSSDDGLKMRNMLQDLANKFPDSTRLIRTVWFLQKNGKITQSEFDNALNFLAVGTISQNPKEFGVNAEALTL